MTNTEVRVRAYLSRVSEHCANDCGPFRTEQPVGALAGDGRASLRQRCPLEGLSIGLVAAFDPVSRLPRPCQFGGEDGRGGFEILERRAKLRAGDAPLRLGDGILYRAIREIVGIILRLAVATITTGVRLTFISISVDDRSNAT